VSGLVAVRHVCKICRTV
jgi:hypothetical protein